MKFWNAPMKLVSAMLLTLTFTTSALGQSTTTLTFDEFQDQTEITTQYQDRGITASGVFALSKFTSPVPPNTGDYLAYSPSGQMTFTLDQSMLSNVQSISTYVSTTSIIGLYAYDSAGALVGQTLSPASTDNYYLTVVSSGNPIASLVIHDSGSSFIIDTLSFVTPPPPPPPPVCTDVVTSVYNQVNALGNQDFKSSPPTRKKALLAEIQKLSTMVQAHSSISKLRTQWSKIQKMIIDGVVESPLKAELLQTMDQLLAMINANKCA